MASPIWSRIDWLAGPKIRIVEQSFVELEMHYTVYWKLYYRCLRGADINFNRMFQFTDSWKTNLISINQQSRRKFTCWRFSWWVLLCRVYFQMKLLGFMSKAIKLLLTELVGQCRNILPLAFSALTSIRSVNTEKIAGNILLHWPPTQLIRV